MYVYVEKKVYTNDCVNRLFNSLTTSYKLILSMFFHQHFTNLLRLKTFTLIMDQSSIFDYVCVIVGHFMLATDIIFRLYVAFFSSRDIGIGV